MSGVAEASAKTNAWPKGIFAITLFVENLEEAKEFYQRVFGLPVDYERFQLSRFQIWWDVNQLIKDYRSQ